MAVLGCILYSKSENVSKIRCAGLSSELSNQRKGTGELSIYSWWIRNSGDKPEMTVGVRTEWISGLVSELENWSGSILYLVSGKKITFLEEENSEGH